MRYYYYLLYNTFCVLEADDGHCYLIVRVTEEYMVVRRLIFRMFEEKCRLGRQQKVYIKDMRKFRNCDFPGDWLKSTRAYSKRENDMNLAKVMATIRKKIPPLEDVVLQKSINEYYVIGLNQEVYGVYAVNGNIRSIVPVVYGIDLLQYVEVKHLTAKERDSFCIRARLMCRTN